MSSSFSFEEFIEELHVGSWFSDSYIYDRVLSRSASARRSTAAAALLAAWIAANGDVLHDAGDGRQNAV